MRFWRSLLWSLKAWVIVAAAVAVLYGVYRILPQGMRDTVSGSLPAWPAPPAMQLVRIILLVLLLNVCTMGFYSPWGVCTMTRWEAEHIG